MKRLPRLLITVLLMFGCIAAIFLQSMQAVTLPTPTPQPFELKVAQLNANQINFGRNFQDLDVEGSILIYDLNSEQIYQHNRDRNATAFLPASTFKILNSLISLETGVIPDEIAILTWDGVQRSIPAWNRDLIIRRTKLNHANSVIIISTAVVESSSEYFTSPRRLVLLIAQRNHSDSTALSS